MNDHAPVITTAAIQTVAENTTAVTTVTATDPDVGQTLSYSIIGGADASKFTIDSNTGALSFVTAPNFELPTDAGGNNVYDVTVQVSDGHGGTDSQAISVSVANTNDVPTINSNGGGATASVSVLENSTAVTTVRRLTRSRTNAELLDHWRRGRGTNSPSAPIPERSLYHRTKL